MRRTDDLSGDFLQATELNDALNAPTVLAVNEYGLNEPEAEQEPVVSDTEKLKAAEKKQTEQEQAKTAQVDSFGREKPTGEEPMGKSMVSGALDWVKDWGEYNMAYNKSMARQFTAKSQAHVASFFDTIDKFSQTLYDGVGAERLGIKRGDIFRKAADYFGQWSQYNESKVNMQDAVSSVLTDLGVAPAGIAEFLMGPGWAGIRGYAQDGEFMDAATEVGYWMTMDRAFKSLHWYNPGKRMLGGAAAMTAEGVARDIGAGQEIDYEKLPQKFFTGLGLMAMGGTAPGAEAQYKRLLPTPAKEWAARYAMAEEHPIYQSMKADVEAGKTDPITLRMAQHLIASNPRMAASTKIKVEDTVRTVKEGVEDFILESEGIDPAVAKAAGDVYQVLGETKNEVVNDVLETAIRLYDGHNPSTVVEEWMHGIHDRLPSADKAIIKKAYGEYVKSLKEGDTPLSEQEFFAQEATHRFFKERKWTDFGGKKEKGIIKKAWEAAQDLYDVVKGMPGAKADKRRLSEVLSDPQPLGDVGVMEPAFQIRKQSEKFSLIRTADADNFSNLKIPDPEQKYTEGGNINLWRIKGEDDIKSLLNFTSDLARDEIVAQKRGSIKHEETKRLAEDLGMTVDQLLSRKEGQTMNAEQIVAARRIMAESGQQLMELVQVMQDPTMRTDQTRAQFAKMLEIHSAIQAQVSGATAEIGRALSALGIDIGAGETELRVRAINEMIDMHGGTGRLDKIAEMMYDLSQMSEDGLLSVTQVSKFAKAAAKPGSSDMVLEVWVNSLLSGPTTHAVNTTSNALVVALSLAERRVAESMGKRELKKARRSDPEANPDRVVPGETAAMWHGIYSSSIGALRLAGKSFLRGESSDPLGKIETMNRTIAAENFNQDPESWVGRGINFLGNALTLGRVPTRALMAADDFMKAVNYQGELEALALRQATLEGLTGEDLILRKNELVNNPPAQVRIDSMEAARYRTFTNDLGAIAKNVSRLSSAKYQWVDKNGKVHTWRGGNAIRFVIPFQRTPVNVFKFGFAHLPGIAHLMPSVRAELNAGGAREQLAKAKISVGTMIASSVAMAAANGKITGGGPTDPKERENWMATGWRPYSIHHNGKYYQYSRLDPFGVMLGITADMWEVAEHVGDKRIEELAAMASMGFAKNVTSKTYLQGVSDFIEVMENPDRYGEKYMLRFAGSFVPNAAKQLNRAFFDPEIKECRTFMETIKGGIPYFSEGVYPRRDRWGEKIMFDQGLGPDILSPSRMSEASTEQNNRWYEIDKIIMENDIRISKPRQTVNYDGVSIELTADEYEAYQVMAGQQIELGKNTMYDALKDLIYSRKFEDSTGGPDGMKAQYIQRVVQRYRRAALDQIYKDSDGYIGGFSERVREERQRLEEEAMQY